MRKLVLCADSESLRHPGFIGLEGETLEGLAWLDVYSNAVDARTAVAESLEAEEAWVLSSDQMDAINLAAAIKRDRPTLRVFLVSSQISGSCLSRAQAAGLDGTLSPRAFALRYAQEKRRHAQSAGQLAAPALAGLVDDVCEEDFAPDEEFASGVPASPQADSRPDAQANLQAGVQPRAQASAFSLCVMGAGGGVGSTAVSLVASHILARRKMSVLLIDADLRLGGLAASAEANVVLSLSEAIDRPESLENAVIAGKVSCIAAPERMELADRLSESLPDLVDRASRLFDAVVVDAGGSFSGLHMDLAERCAQSLLLVGQRSSSVRACKRIVDMFQRCGAATNSIVFAINCCSKGSLFSSIDVSCLLQGSNVRELRDGGRIVEELVGIGAASSLVVDGNPFAVSLGHLLQELLPESPDKTLQQTKSSPIRLLGEGLRARKSQRDQKRGDFREHDAA